MPSRAGCAALGGAVSRRADSGGAVSGGAVSRRADSGGADSGGAISRGADSGGPVSGGAVGPAAGPAADPLAPRFGPACFAAAALAGRFVPVRSGIEVCSQAVPAALPPEAGLAVTAERAGWVEPVVRVGPDHPGAQPLRHPQDAAPLLGPDPRRQPVGSVVRLRHRLFRG